jgi:hypothetical protein
VSSDRLRYRLSHVVENIVRIEQHVAGLPPEDYGSNGLVRDAVERCPQRVAEAIRKLDDLAFIWLPDQPVAQIRTFGNVLRHDYDPVDNDLIRRIVWQDLPGLKAACLAALERLDRELDKAP